MSTSLIHCEVHRTSKLSEIISALEGNPLSILSSHKILIGSRAARRFLPNFRGISDDKNADTDIICSSNVLLEWLRATEKDINSINMIIPKSNDDNQLDIYVYCTLTAESKYDFVVPQSLTSYTGYILNNPVRWIKNESRWGMWHQETDTISTASAELLLILKKYMLYYSHQWEKTAKDYRELLTVAKPLTNDEKELCDLFVQYNEKVFGKRPSDANEFVVNPTNTRNGITITRDEFSQYENDKKISFLYQTAMSLASNDDILIGLEQICTQGPPWLADYTIENWIAIHQEKFQQKFQPLRPCIEFEIDNHRLFPEIPEIPTKRILNFITDTADFHSMQLVCKQWYTILREEIFWRDLYISRYGQYSGQVNNINSWKMLYFVRLEGKCAKDNDKLEQLVDATIKLRQFTSNDILQLWEDLTHQNQSVESIPLSKINHILSNSFYYQIKKTSDIYSVGLIINGLEHGLSRSKVCLNLRVGDYGGSRFTDHMEELSIKYESSTNEHHSLSFLGPALLGFYMGEYGYVFTGRTELGSIASVISDQYPPGLLICLFIMMVHPDHRAQFIKYLKNIESHCLRGFSYMGY